MDHDVDHFMLFQILLSHALKARSTVRLSQISFSSPPSPPSFLHSCASASSAGFGNQKKRRVKTAKEKKSNTCFLFSFSLSPFLISLYALTLKKIWQVMPHGFGIFDLLSLVRSLLIEERGEDRGGEGERRKVMADDDEEILMVEVFRPQLLRMWNASKQGDKVLHKII